MTAEPPAEWEAVFFDIGGVIVNLPSIRQGYARFLQSFAAEHDLDSEAALDTWRETLGEYFRGADGTEYRPAHAGYQRAFEALVDDIDEDDWLPGFREATGEALEPNPGAVETSQALADAGLTLGIISDIDSWEAQRMLDAFDVGDAFDDVTTSEAVGYKKPDSRMFQSALDATGVDPGRSLYVGDRYEHDMEGGSTAGLWTVAYGGTAAEEVEDAQRDGHRVHDDPAVDFVVEDLRTLLELTGLDD